MAVQLFLNDTEVITDSTQEIRITRENPYVTLSDSYTLDVSLPLDILQNRRFFGNLQRIDTTKQYREFACRLLCNNALLMEGTARIVQSTDLVVKVQLACGVSALKLSSEQEGMYIDQLLTDPPAKGLTSKDYMDYVNVRGTGDRGYGAILKDSTSGMVVNMKMAYYAAGALRMGFPLVSECPRLLDVARLIAGKLGYSVDMSCLPPACGSIYVMSAAQGCVGRKLPHWTVKEFMAEFQNFFGATFVRSGDRSLRLVPLDSYAANPVTEIEPVAEFQVEYTEEDAAEGIINRNVEFDMESSDLEVVDEEVLAQAKSEGVYTDEGAMRNAFRTDTDSVRMRKLYRLNGETYIGWEIPGENEGDPSTYELRRVAPFNPLRRFEGAESVSLRIAPAYMEEDVECVMSYNLDTLLARANDYKVRLTIPSVSSPYGLRPFYEAGDSAGDDDTATLQELVEGVEAVASGDERPDTMSVAFIDGRTESVVAKNEYIDSEVAYRAHLAFTDYNFKKQLANNRSRWSLSLNPLPGCEFYLGQLHRISFTCSHKVKHIVKFVSPSIPEPTDIFLIRGKRFACEKIEASVRDGRLDPLITGYFYEFLS